MHFGNAVAVETEVQFEDDHAKGESDEYGYDETLETHRWAGSAVVFAPAVRVGNNGAGFALLFIQNSVSVFPVARWQTTSARFRGAPRQRASRILPIQFP